MERASDSTLVRDALAGHTEAFASLVRRYQDYAYGVAVGMLSDFDLARDVVQESFLAVYHDLRKLREPDRFAGWLRGIVRNKALRAARELAQVKRLAEELRHVRGRPAGPTRPDVALERREQQQLVRDALGRLNQKNREAVCLYYVDGLSYAQIADFLDVTPTAVQGRLQRGRGELRKELAMVEESFKENELPEDFADEVAQLLERASQRGEDGQRAVDRLAQMGGPAVDPLCEALEDPRGPVRRAAASALCEIGDERALEPLLRILYSEDAVLHGLYRTGRILSVPGMRGELLRIVRERVGPLLYDATRALESARGDTEAFECLCELFRDRSAPAHSRRAAAAAACAVRPEAGPDIITEALRDPGINRAGSMAWLASHWGIEIPIDALLCAFGAEVRPGGSRCAAARLVLRHGDEGRSVLTDLVRNGSPDQRVTAALGLAAERDPGAFEVLRDELLRDSLDKKLRCLISRILGGRYPQELAGCVERGGGKLAEAGGLLWALARSGGPAPERTVAVLLRRGTPSVRAACVRVLSRVRGGDFIQDLRTCLRDGRPAKAAREALRAMERLGQTAEPVVRQMLGSEHWTERKAAACLLRRWGKLTDENRTVLQRDPHRAVRDMAAQAPTHP